MSLRDSSLAVKCVSLEYGQPYHLSFLRKTFSVIHGWLPVNRKDDTTIKNQSNNYQQPQVYNNTNVGKIPGRNLTFMRMQTSDLQDKEETESTISC